MTTNRRHALRWHGVLFSLIMAAYAPWVNGVVIGDPDGVNGYFDTTMSYGAAWRAASRDAHGVGADNGGKGSNNADDGNLNYDKGKLVSSRLSATHELDLRYRNFEFFGRANYFYDFENFNRTGPAPVVGGVRGSGYTLGDRAQELVGRDFRLLDAYLKGTFSLGERTTQVRLGNQVVSWGESFYIPNGINVINPVDVAKLRAPGSELKEALLPTPMLWASQEISSNVHAEAYVAAQFKKIEIDPRGTFFSTTDIVGGDGHTLYLTGPDQHFPPAPFGTQTISRSSDRDAPDHGEYGLALRILAPALKDTEFGLYYVNYHYRAPIVSLHRGGVNVAGIPFPPFDGSGAPTSAAADYFVEYPKNVRLYGVSFNTTGPAGIALQGEYSYRPNLPLQVSVGELILAAIGLPNSVTGLGAAANSVPVGTEISGYRRVSMQQAHLSASKGFSHVLGADQLVVFGEAAYTRLGLDAGVNFAGYGETTPAGSFGAPTSSAGQGFATRNSWGYQVSFRADYNNAIGPVQLSPHLAFSQAVRGVSPTWNEGTKSVSVGLSATFKGQWRGDISYTGFWGGRTFNDSVDTNGLRDRDFVSASLSYAF